MKQVTGFKCDYCNKIFNNKQKCLKHENWHKEIKKIINTPIDQKQEQKEIEDTTCWYIDPYKSDYKVFNQNGETVKLNNKQSKSDYQFWKELHLKQKPTDFAWLYECIVYGHNFRNGYVKTIATDQEEAINYVRINFTKYLKDEIVKEN